MLVSQLLQRFRYVSNRK